jgi:hypothetical protein
MAGIGYDALVSELVEQGAGPSRVGADFEHDKAVLEAREELVECLFRGGNFGPPEDRAFRAEKA